MYRAKARTVARWAKGRRPAGTTEKYKYDYGNIFIISSIFCYDSFRKYSDFLEIREFEAKICGFFSRCLENTIKIISIQILFLFILEDISRMKIYLHRNFYFVISESLDQYYDSLTVDGVNISSLLQNYAI